MSTTTGTVLRMLPLRFSMPKLTGYVGSLYFTSSHRRGSNCCFDEHHPIKGFVHASLIFVSPFALPRAQILIPVQLNNGLLFFLLGSP